jgi:hypothetical protein
MVVVIARSEPIFYKGYGAEGEESIEEAKRYMDEEKLRKYKKVKRAYDQKKAAARAEPRRVPHEVLQYRCEDDSLLKPEPNGTSVYCAEDPFEQPNVSVLMNWSRIEY